MIDMNKEQVDSFVHLYFSVEKKAMQFFYDIRDEYNNAKRGRGLEWVEGVCALDNSKKKLVVFIVLCRTLTL